MMQVPGYGYLEDSNSDKLMTNLDDDVDGHSLQHLVLRAAQVGPCTSRGFNELLELHFRQWQLSHLVCTVPATLCNFLLQLFCILCLVLSVQQNNFAA